MIPGFTAESSLARRSEGHRRFPVRGIPPDGVRPAAVFVPRVICWCAEEGICEVESGPFKWGYECCLRMDCVMVPVVIPV